MSVFMMYADGIQKCKSRLASWLSFSGHQYLNVQAADYRHANKTSNVD